MCGCKRGTNAYVNSTSCGGKVAELHKIRNDLIILTKLAETPEKKQEYEDLITDVEQLLKDSVGTCPDRQTIIYLRQYVDNEFTIYNN